jgi:2-methylfumaryl-CoA isomerase
MADLVRASGPDGEGRAITLALEDVALAVTGHLGFLAEAQLTGTGRPRPSNKLNCVIGLAIERSIT